MSNGVKRFGKGLFAIFMIKLTLVFGVLVFQACQTDNVAFEENEKAKDNFLAAFKLSNNQLNEISINPSGIKGDVKGNDLMKENTDVIATFKMCLLLDQNDDTTPSNTGVIDPTSIGTFGDVIDIGNQTGTRPVLVDNSTNEPVDDTIDDFGFSMCFDVPSVPIEQAMESSLLEAKNYLYSKQFNDNDILEILEGNHESTLIPLVMALIAEEQAQNSSVSVDFSILFGDTVHAESDLYDCALRSLGVTALSEAFSNGLKSSAGKRALKKAIRKIAARTLNWIGVAWAAYEFGDCMDWW